MAFSSCYIFNNPQIKCIKRRAEKEEPVIKKLREDERLRDTLMKKLMLEFKGFS